MQEGEVTNSLQNSLARPLKTESDVLVLKDILLVLVSPSDAFRGIRLLVADAEDCPSHK
jgi:hypothetical protein